MRDKQKNKADKFPSGISSVDLLVNKSQSFRVIIDDYQNISMKEEIANKLISNIERNESLQVNQNENFDVYQNENLDLTLNRIEDVNNNPNMALLGDQISEVNKSLVQNQNHSQNLVNQGNFEERQNSNLCTFMRVKH